MNSESMFNKLNLNEKTIKEEAVRLLLKIADNILANPANLKVRTLNKNNATIAKKLIAVEGGVDCLQHMGFQENETSFVLPNRPISLKQVQMFKAELVQWKNRKSVEIVDEKISNGIAVIETIKPIVLPPLILNHTNPFLRRIEVQFHRVLTYEDKNLQARARALVPVLELETKAQLKLRQVQQEMKQNKLGDPNISLQDFLILELLDWFKHDFFTWVDSPACQKCGAKTRMSHMSEDAAHLKYTTRVELHKCETCSELTPFPRYDDLNILLETRRGRCGEWANTFTLFCRSLNWDARFVVDEGDHVWTEVYLIAQQRWMHCDPCENVCDTPLVYEAGWKKQISYVMAFSAEDLQDVTWRYSSNHAAVRLRRKNCSEKELLDAIVGLRKRRQMALTESRRSFLTKRLLNELVEFLVEKKVSERDESGRTSGAESWRVGRGEAQEVAPSGFVWVVKEGDVSSGGVVVRYSSVLDRYELVCGDRTKLEMDGWYGGAFDYKNVFRKEEKDWKMVYLARKEKAETGEITWKFRLESTSKVIDKVKVRLDHQLYENGNVFIEVSSQDNKFSFKNQSFIEVGQFESETWFIIRAKLEGGVGDVAWQHVQLFRQSINDSGFPFHIEVTFKNVV